MTKIKKITCVLLVASVICALSSITAYAIDPIVADIKVESSATIEDDFDDDKVLVLLTQESSWTFKEYTVSDFSEIDCKKVVSLMSALTDVGKKVTKEIANALANGKTPDVPKSLDFGSFRNIICIELNEPGKENVISAIKQLEQREDVLCASPNYHYSLNNICDNFDNTNGYQDYVSWDEIAEYLELDKVWNALENGMISYNTERVIEIAVIDSGIQHSVFSGDINWDKSAIAVDCQGDYNNPNLPTGFEQHVDHQGHGTHVAGIIGSTLFPDFIDRSNDLVNNNFRFISVNVVDANYNTDLVELIAAVNHMIQLTTPINSNVTILPPIINLSLGDPFNTDSAEDIMLFMQALDNYPGLIVCSAGNDNYDTDDGNYYPASWNLDNLIKVGACTLESEKCEYSSYGADTIDLFSVGEYIYSTYSNQICTNSACQKYETHISTGYHSLRGTSMATSFVTGVAAILLAIDPTLTALELKSIIEGTVVECDALIDECETGGRLNAYNAVMTLLDHSNHSKSYTQKSAEEHNTICNVCNCTYPEEHVQFRGVEIPNNIHGHTATCMLCNYTGFF